MNHYVTYTYCYDLSISNYFASELIDDDNICLLITKLTSWHITNQILGFAKEKV